MVSLALPKAIRRPSSKAPELKLIRTPAQNILLVVCVSLMMVLTVMANSSLNIALPTMATSLGIPSSRLEWPVSSYALAFGCLLLFLGRLSDIFGKRYFFLGGAVVFLVFNIAGALAQTEIQVDVFRALSGAGAAASVPSAVSIISSTFAPTSPYRAIAFAAFSAGAPVGSGLGSIFGGVFTQYSPASWRAIFWFTAGLSIIPILLGWFVVPEDRLDPARDTRVDFVGAFLIVSALVFLIFALSDGQTAPDQWRTSYIIATLVLSIILLGAFVAWEHYLVISSRFTTPPLLPLAIFRRARLSVILLVGFAGWCSFQPCLYHATLYFQQYLHLSPIHTMIRFLPTCVSGLIVNVVFAVVVPWLPGWWLIAIGTISMSLSGMLFAIIRTSQPYWAYAFPALTISVFGADFIYASSTLYISSIAGPGEQGLCGGLFTTATQLGVAFGLAISTVVNDAASKKSAEALGVTLHDDASNLPSSSLLAGLRAAQWTSMAFGAAAFVICIAFLRSVQVLGHRRKIKGSEIEPKALEEDKVEPLDEAGDPNTGTDGVDTTSLEFKSRV